MLPIPDIPVLLQMKPLCQTFYRCRRDGVAKSLALILGYVIKLPQLSTIFVIIIPRYIRR
jgi:hypothetical protein